MSNRLVRWWDEQVCGPWTENKNWSRKWLIVWLTVAIAIGLDIAGRPLSSDTLGYMGIAIPAWVAVQGGIDFMKYRRERKAYASLAAELVKEQTREKTGTGHGGDDV